MNEPRAKIIRGSALTLFRIVLLDSRGGILRHKSGAPVEFTLADAQGVVRRINDGEHLAEFIDPGLAYEIRNPGRPYLAPVYRDGAMLEPEPREFQGAPRDIFEWLLPNRTERINRVYVLGGGARGVEQYGRIPKYAYVFSCNSAVLARKRPPTLAFMFDRRCSEQAWWADALNVKTMHVYSSYLAKKSAGDWYFSFTPHLFERPYCCLISGRLRGGANVAGVAMQAAFWMGAREIILCGVEMLDTEHWDGTNAGVKNADGLWPCLGNVNMLIREIEKFGVSVWSMNETALDIPVRN